jgi:hypothetical protein
MVEVQVHGVYHRVRLEEEVCGEVVLSTFGGQFCCLPWEAPHTSSELTLWYIPF